MAREMPARIVYNGLKADVSGQGMIQDVKVVIPALLGMVWLVSPAAVFLTGAVFALVSLTLARLIPEQPEPGVEVRFARLRLA